MLFVLAAFLSGVTIVVSRMINARLSDHIGAMHGSFVNHVTGLAASVALAAALGQIGLLNPAALHGVPWWGYLGGVFGVLVVALSNHAAPRSSALTMTVVIFAGQLITGAVIDYFLFGIFTAGKAIGGCILIAGLYICMSGPKKSSQS